MSESRRPTCALEQIVRLACARGLNVDEGAQLCCKLALGHIAMSGLAQGLLPAVLKANTMGAGSFRAGSACMARAISSWMPTHDAQSEAPVINIPFSTFMHP